MIFGRLGLNMLRLVTVCSLSLGIALVSATTYDVPDDTPDNRPLPMEPNLFRIGHVRSDGETALGTDTLDRLRAELLATASVRSALDGAGIQDVVVQTADTYQNLIDGMSQNQFDLVFCTSVAFVQQGGEYDALFQFRRKRDTFSPRGDRVLHRGVVIVNNRSPLFGSPDAQALLSSVLMARPMAMVGSFSAAGYVYPMLRLRDLTTSVLVMPPPLFCGSSEEVVKAVINGATDMGACDRGVVDEVLDASGLGAQRDSLVRVVVETDAIPTDPVALRRKWRPTPEGGSPSGAVGREVRDAVRRFFHRHPHLPRLEPCKEERYPDVISALRRLSRLQQGITSGRVANK